MSLQLFHAIIEVPPLIKKNSKPIWVNKRTGKTFVGKNPRIVEYEPEFLWLLRQTWNRIPITIPIQALFTYYYDGPEPDLSNLHEFPQDALQIIGIIMDDRLIKSHDGSRKYHVCEGCKWYDPETKKRQNSTQKLVRCPGVKHCKTAKPRIEISLYKFEGNKSIQHQDCPACGTKGTLIVGFNGQVLINCCYCTYSYEFVKEERR